MKKNRSLAALILLLVLAFDAFSFFKIKNIRDKVNLFMLLKTSSRSSLLRPCFRKPL